VASAFYQDFTYRVSPPCFNTDDSDTQRTPQSAGTSAFSSISPRRQLLLGRAGEQDASRNFTRNVEGLRRILGGWTGMQAQAVTGCYWSRTASWLAEFEAGHEFGEAEACRLPVSFSGGAPPVDMMIARNWANSWVTVDSFALHEVDERARKELRRSCKGHANTSRLQTPPGCAVRRLQRGGFKEHYLSRH